MGLVQFVQAETLAQITRQQNNDQPLGTNTPNNLSATTCSIINFPSDKHVRDNADVVLKHLITHLHHEKLPEINTIYNHASILLRTENLSVEKISTRREKKLSLIYIKFCNWHKTKTELILDYRRFFSRTCV